MRNGICLLGVAGVLSVAGGSIAVGGGFDVLLLPDRGAGVLRTGAFDDATQSVVSLDERVFTGEFGKVIPGEPNYTDEPGFRALTGEFNSGDAWGFWITDAVRVWDPLGGHFDDLSPYSITLGFGPWSVTSSAVAGGVVNGFDITIPGMGFDDHLDITLNAPMGLEADGVYLLRLSLRATGLAPSEPIWFVLNRGKDKLTFEAAEEYVRDVLVPSPGTCAAFAVLAFGATRRRRDR